MERLIIAGNKKYLDIIVRENKLRTSKYGLKISFEKVSEVKQAQTRKKAGSTKASEASKAGTDKK